MLVYLLLGSNSGDRVLEIVNAIQRIRKGIGEIKQGSSIYETEPWGFQAEVYFLNQVICVQTILSPEELMEEILNIETETGRIRKNNGYHSRTIDIDILFYSNDVINTESIKIPHPLLHLRRFVLEPLKEIAPDYIHPVIHKSILDIYNECGDNLIVKKHSIELTAL